MQRLKGRSARSQSIGTKLTPEEEAKILAAAEAEGRAPSEWVREKLLECAIPGGGSAAMLTHIFTDLVGLEMLFMNVIGRLWQVIRFRGSASTRSIRKFIG
jgi:hypothetical protein